MNAQAILIQATNAQGVVTQLLSLGFITMGPLTRAGIEFFPTIPNDPSVERDWAIVSGPASFSPAASLLVLDKSAGVSPVSLRWRQAVPAWEWMKTVGSLGPTTEKVTLGSGFDSSLQGYWDEAYLKRISMETKAGNTAFAGEWTDVPYNTANYSGSGSLVWTPTSSADQISYAYEITGQKMTLIFEVQGILTGADSSDLRLAVPGGYVVGSRASSNHAAWAIDNNDATNPEVAIKANPGLGYVSLQKSTSGHLTNWVAGGNLAYVQGEIILSIA
jgi:hypothetical protein